MRTMPEVVVSAAFNVAFLILLPRALPWADIFCPYRANTPHTDKTQGVALG